MPSPEIVKKALELIRKRPANHDYFFSQLTSPDWIGPLDDAGLFSSPPPAVREGDTISFPFWPESQYLARVALDAPKQVAAVMMKIPETDNLRVHEDLSHAAAKLPADLAARWARKETAWVESQDHLYLLLPEALGDLIEHLATSGEIQAALTLARAVLAVRLSDDTSPRRALARFDPWHYKQLLQKSFPEVLRQGQYEALSLLCDLLEDALAEDSDQGNDYSWIWRPAIEPHAQNRPHGDVRDALIDAIRDGSLQLTQKGMEPQVVVEELIKRPRPIFKRLALHLLVETHEHQAARDLLCERENFLDARLWHEYSRLLGSVFADLDQEARSTILAWIEAGPSLEEKDNEDPELRRKQKAHWQAQRLFGLRGQLPDEWEQNYSAIVSELGEPEHPDFLSYTTTWTGPRSPKKADDLESMSAEDVASFLKSWEPSHAWHTPEPEGLGRVLEAVVAKSADRFIATLDAFRDVDPTYARALVQGLNEAVKSGHPIEWHAVIEYLAWVTRQPRTAIRESGGGLDRDPHWGWARKAAMSLLSAGFERNSIGIRLREAAWRIVETVADDPDPTPADDEKSTMDPATRSINTTRGEALHAVVRYALWVRRQLTGDGIEPDRSNFDMSSIPEVRERLERHLDLAVEPSPAIRAVFGQWFPWLLLLDKFWAEARIEIIFPSENPALRDAAWLTYLAFCPVYNETFLVLRAQYSASVDCLQVKAEGTSGWLGSPGERLGEHLLVMFGRGALDWSDEDSLLKRFFDNAPVQDSSHAIAYVGRALLNESNPVPAEVVARLRGLWEELARYVLEDDPGKSAELLRQFGWWFASGRFEVEWAFDQLDRVIETKLGVKPDFKVMERLAELASEHPARCLAALKGLVRQDERAWTVLDWKGSARTVLQAALDTEATKSDAELLIHELGARGHLQFRGLLNA